MPSATTAAFSGAANGLVDGLRWGTYPPLCLEDGQLGPLRLRAHGHFSLQLPAGADPAPLPALLAWLRPRIRAALADQIEQMGLPPAALPDQLEPLAGRLRLALEPVVAERGLALPLISIAALVLPEALAPRLLATAPALQLHVLLNDQASGPFTLPQVAALRWRGELQPDSWVWHAELADWQPAAELPELAPLFRLPPSPPPLPA